MTVNTQHTSRQDAIIAIKLYMDTYFGRKRPSSGQLRIILRYSKNSGDRGSTVVKVLCYKSEGRWFDPSWCHWNFSLT